MPQLTKQERLHGAITVSLFFAHAKRFTSYPLRVSYAPSSKEQARLLVSIPKKFFKHAVDRNLLKRRVREAYRKNKPNFPVDIAFIYVSNEIASSEEIEKAVVAAIQKVTLKLQENG